MPPTANSHDDCHEADEGAGRAYGSTPQRSRPNKTKTKSSKPRSQRSKRKANAPNGIHQRRNKRVSW